MVLMAFYAWSPIKYSYWEGKEGEEKEVHVSIDRGSQVDKNKLKGIRDEDWNAMIESNAIRNKKFPAPKNFEGSALDYLRQELSESRVVSPVDEEEAVSELEVVESLAR